LVTWVLIFILYYATCTETYRYIIKHVYNDVNSGIRFKAH